LLNKACQDINRKKADIFDCVMLVGRFAACGGRRSLAESAIWNIQLVKERDEVAERMKTITFADKDTDFFEIYGVANPLDSHSF